MKLPRKCERSTWQDRVVILTAELAGFLDLLIFLCSLTYFISSYRGDVLFSNWALDFRAKP